MTPTQLADLKAAVHARGKGRTHWATCFLEPDHRDCAVLALLAHIESLEAENARMREALETIAHGRWIGHVREPLREWDMAQVADAALSTRTAAQAAKEKPNE